MYKQVETHDTCLTDHGTLRYPVATLEDGYGGRSHIAIDDHCYQLLQEIDWEVTPNSPKIRVCVPVRHIYPEAHAVLKTLPHPDIAQAAINYSERSELQIPEALIVHEKAAVAGG